MNRLDVAALSEEQEAKIAASCAEYIQELQKGATRSIRQILQDSGIKETDALAALEKTLHMQHILHGLQKM